MIHEIADVIASKIKEKLSWADLCVGLVKEVSAKNTLGEDITIPVYFNNEWGNCNMSDYLSVVPDGSKASVIYLEMASEPSVTGVDARGGVGFDVDLDLVVWYNANMINYNITESDLLLAEVIDSIPNRVNGTVSYGNFVEVTGAKIKDRSVFDKYSYNKEQQYLMYPYDFFVINLNVTYTIPRGCVSVTEKKSVCVTKPDLS
jgi:hypothetical protein